ncbi:MAG: DUF1549 and DUF1553 domain-containing protein [Planctomycetaceae bacterium]
MTARADQLMMFANCERCDMLSYPSVSFVGRPIVRCCRWLLSLFVLMQLVGPGELFAAEPVDFATEIQPLLTRYGCNAGACHGKQRGQNGFQLSLLGFDDDFDHKSLVAEGRGRRVSLSRPESSLLLTKPTGVLPHGGGVRLRADAPEYRLLLRWIQQGATRGVAGRPSLLRISVAPTARRFAQGETQPLIVTAHWSDNSTSDVTPITTFQSSESAIAQVNEGGLVTAGPVIGEAAVMARFLGQFAIFTASVPFPGEVDPALYAKLPRVNFIDDFLWAGHQRLGLLPSAPANDATFLRRATIDIIGRLPTVAEAEAFLKDTSPHRRETLVEQLLAHPEYAEHWANKWADLLRPNPYHVGIKATLNYDAWIRDAFRRNQPYDEFVRELLTAEGSTFKNGNVTLFRDRRAPEEITTLVSQLFLGVRLECAKCHHHPFEVYGQEDFYSFAAYFAKLGRKGTGISAPISGSEEFVYASEKGEVKHPLTGAVLSPRPLFGPERDAIKNASGEAVVAVRDPRTELARWITAPENTFFAQTMANRVWADLMGIGLVEPVDDLRSTNPPVNGPLLEALGRDFAEHDFDIKHLIRRIVLSHAYGLSSIPNERNVVDTRHYSRHYRQRLRAEVLLDSLCEITGQPETFSAMPEGSLARELWTHRISSLFLDAYGRPDPNQDPPCERTTEPTVVQTLHLMNSDNLFRKVTSDSGRAAELAKSERSPTEIVTYLYLSIYSRVPTEEELRIGVGLYDNEGSRRQATEDLMWAMINTPEFVFKD